MKIKTFLKKHGIGLGILAILAADLLLKMPRAFSGWAPTWYALDYSLGYGSRLLVGSVLHLLYGGMPSNSAAVKFVSAAAMMLAVLYAILMDALHNRASEETKKPLGYFMLLTAAAPYGLPYLWNEANFGRLDLFLVLTLTAALLTLLVVKKPLCRAAAVGIFSLIALFIHQVFFFIFFPVLLGILLFDVFDGTSLTCRRLMPGLICCGVVGITFLILQLFSGLNVPTVEELMAQLTAQTDLDISRSALDFEYYHDFIYGFVNHTLPFLEGGRVFIKLFLTLLVLSPMGLVYAFLHREMGRELSASGVAGKQRLLNPQPWLLLLLVFYLPPFVLTVDWNRWIGAMFLSAALLLMLLLIKGNGPARIAFEKLGAALEQYPFLFLLLLAYAAKLNTLEARMFLPEVEALMGILRAVF